MKRKIRSGIFISVLLLVLIPSASAHLYGDANEDTQINMQDVTWLERMVLEYDPTTTSADANQDDNINMQDVTLIESIILEQAPFPVYETLFKYDDEMRLTPELATGYTQVNDNEWLIHLREDVVFHDGSPFNANAVVYSFARVMDESNSRSSEYDHIASITAVDEHTVRITTAEPYAPTIASLTNPLVSIVSPDADNLDTHPAFHV